MACAWLFAADPSAARVLEPAAGGGRLLGAAESAVMTVVGVVRSPAPLDRNGWAGRLEVERVLAGELQPSDSLRIAWEELAPGRPPRFSEGGRVVVALESLPSASLWRSRFPNGDAWLVGASGEAFLREPDPLSLDGLAAYLVLPRGERDGAAGVDALSGLLASARPPLASAALERLARVPGLASKIGEPARATLANALDDPDRPEPLRGDLLALIGQRRLEVLRPAVIQQARPGSPVEAAAWQALADLDGQLSAPQVDALLQRDEAALRQVAVRQASSSPSVEAKLPALITQDPDGEVRALAVETWLQLRAAAGLPEAEAALFDREPFVRGRAARAVGGLGAEGVPRMQELVAEATPERALGPIAALRAAGRPGQPALREIAGSHPDKQVRTLAKLALGEEIRPH